MAEEQIQDIKNQIQDQLKEEHGLVLGEHYKMTHKRPELFEPTVIYIGVFEAPVTQWTNYQKYRDVTWPIHHTFWVEPYDLNRDRYD